MTNEISKAKVSFRVTREGMIDFLFAVGQREIEVASGLISKHFNFSFINFFIQQQHSPTFTSTFFLIFRSTNIHLAISCCWRWLANSYIKTYWFHLRPMSDANKSMRQKSTTKHLNLSASRTRLKSANLIFLLSNLRSNGVKEQAQDTYCTTTLCFRLTTK